MRIRVGLGDLGLLGVDEEILITVICVHFIFFILHSESVVSV